MSNIVIGILVWAIGIIPLVLAAAVRKLYGESKLSRSLFIYMIGISVWQGYVGILYFGQVWSEKTILFVFQLLRFGLVLAIPVVFYLVYTIMQDQIRMKSDRREKILRLVFTKRNLYVISAWSLVVYIIGLTPLGIEGLRISYSDFTSQFFYFPIYGPLHWIFIVHMGTFIIFLAIVYFLSGKIQNGDMKNFLRRLSVYSILLYLSGYINFFPGTGIIVGSIGVIIFSTLIMAEFVMLNTNMKLNYYKLMERQKKMDYTGTLTGSLIHEVKNTNEIIKGFSNMLGKSEDLTERDKRTLEMVQKSSEHLEELTNNFKRYMNASNLKFARENLESVIKEAIELSTGLLRDNRVEVEFISKYNHLNVYANKTNLEQVFFNLIKNSVEAMPEENKERKIKIETELEHDMVIIHFIDTGKGIPPENWESVFDPFISMSSRGMGYGLPFVKKTTIEHLGNIHIENSSPCGTHFRIEIPQDGILNAK